MKTLFVTLLGAALALAVVGLPADARAQEVVRCPATVSDGPLSSSLPGTVTYFSHSLINCTNAAPPPPALSTTVWLEHLNWQAHPEGAWERVTVLPTGEDLQIEQYVSELYLQRYIVPLDGLNCYRTFTLFTIFNPVPYLPSFASEVSGGVCV